jgi:hypothetical protein
MAQEDRIKGLETITRTLGERLDGVDEKLKKLSKSSEESRFPHWAVSVLVGMVLAWMGWLSVQIIGQGQKITGIMMILNPQETLKTLGSVSMKPQEAKKGLTQVAASFRQLSQDKVSLPEKTIDETAEDLSKISTVHQDLPETWTAIGEFISYRSRMLRGWERTNMPLCDDQFYKLKITAPIAPDPNNPNENIVTHGPVEIHDCKIFLDSLGSSLNLSLDLSLADVIFTHCAVFYDGGPIVFVPVQMSVSSPAKFLGSVTFQDCLFIFSFQTVPPEHGMELARTLLTFPNGHIKLSRIS